MAGVQPDHYLALGITPDASDAEVRAAYLRAMRGSHPDHHPGDAEAESAARAANAAWEVLGDRARRGAYDRLRTPGGDRAPAVLRVDEGIDEERIAAHRAQGQAISREIQRASVRVAAALFAGGLLLLLAVVR
jgi:curved DNA-binding protein CbpA